MTRLVGVVAIGRNEGQRLVRCLQSLREQEVPVRIVYVDSNSTDDSVKNAREFGAEVVDLDTSIKFTAARARNAGLGRLLELEPKLEFVQFVDGDCELDARWLPAALDFFDSHPEHIVVCGRRREKFPDSTVYNRICDIEWNTPPGEAGECGGDALMRVAPLQKAGGYDPTLIAGEEPDLCIRMRAEGGRVYRLDHEMTLHDAAMTRASEWFKRAKRSGHACAELAYRHSGRPEQPYLRQARSMFVWGIAYPLAWLAGALSMVTFVALGRVDSSPLVGLAALALSLGALVAPCALLGVRSYQYERRGRQPGRSARDARIYATSNVLAKLPAGLGAMRFLFNRWTGKQSTLVEYKGAA